MNGQVDMFQVFAGQVIPCMSPTETSSISCDKSSLPLQEQYTIWHELPGARHILKHFFAITAAYVDEWRATKIPVSATLIMELVRHKVKHRIGRAEQRDIQLAKWGGYTVNNNFRPLMARELMSKRPDWLGIFEVREMK